MRMQHPNVASMHCRSRAAQLRLWRWPDDHLLGPVMFAGYVTWAVLLGFFGVVVAGVFTPDQSSVARRHLEITVNDVWTPTEVKRDGVTPTADAALGQVW